jgi:hypothetical protein
MRPIALLATLLFASSGYLDAACHKPPKPRIDWLGTLTGCSPTSGTCAALEPINFFAKTADGSSYAACDKFDWNFNDGSAHSMLQNPTHIFVRPGGFNVLLQISNDQGSDGDGKLVPVVATVLPSIVDFKATASRVTLGERIVFSWNTKNSKGIRIDASSGQPFPLLDSRSIGTVAFTPMKSTVYTLTALGDAAHSPPSLITVEVLAAAKRRSVKR